MKKNIFLKSKNSVALMTVLLFLLLVMIFQAAVLTYVNNNARISEKRKASERALYYAESGIEFAKYWITKQDTMQNKSSGDLIPIPSSKFPDGVSNLIITYQGTDPSNKYTGVCGYNPFSYISCAGGASLLYPTRSDDHCGTLEEIYTIESTGRSFIPWDNSDYTERKITAEMRKSWDVTVVRYRGGGVWFVRYCWQKIILTPNDPFLNIINWKEIKE